jgi:hypothetical protein
VADRFGAGKFDISVELGDVAWVLDLFFLELGFDQVIGPVVVFGKADGFQVTIEGERILELTDYRFDLFHEVLLGGFSFRIFGISRGVKFSLEFRVTPKHKLVVTDTETCLAFNIAITIVRILRLGDTSPPKIF